MWNPLSSEDRKGTTVFERTMQTLMYIMLFVGIIWMLNRLATWFIALPREKKLRVVAIAVIGFMTFCWVEIMLQNPIDNPDKYTPREVYEARRAQREKDMREDPEHWQDEYMGVIP